jgi:hypothetical protein
MTETEEQIARLTRATAARARCARQVTHATVKATMAHTDQGRAEWTSIRDEARSCRDAWDVEIRNLRRQLTAV